MCAYTNKNSPRLFLGPPTPCSWQGFHPAFWGSSASTSRSSGFIVQNSNAHVGGTCGVSAYPLVDLVQNVRGTVLAKNKLLRFVCVVKGVALVILMPCDFHHHGGTQHINPDVTQDVNQPLIKFQLRNVYRREKPGGGNATEYRQTRRISVLWRIRSIVSLECVCPPEGCSTAVLQHYYSSYSQ